MADDECRVLFVCTGNTCRSPMAEGLFRAAVCERGMEGVSVGSAGVSAMDGGAASSETLEVLHQRGLELEGFHSRMVDESILAEATHVFCMTRGHLERLEAFHPEFTDKFYLACEFCQIDGEVGRDVPDPIGQGLPAYEAVAACLDEAITGILGFLEAGRPKGPR